MPRLLLVLVLLTTTVALAVGLTGGAGTQPVAAASGGVATMAAAAPSDLVSDVHSAVVGGVQRTYLTVVPAGATGPLPLLVVLHGRGQSRQTVVDQTGFLRLAEQRQAALVYPDGLQRSWNAGHGCCGAAGARGNPDVAFVSTVVAAVLHTLPVDVHRVYVAGFSNGGKLAYSAVCAHPALFAAVATYGSVPLTPCPAGAPPVPAFLAAGAHDVILPYNGAPHGHPPLPPVRTAVAWLRAQDGCTGAAQVSTVGPATVQHWTRCRAGAEVESVLYPGLGHTWPTRQLVGRQASAEALMWPFLSRHRLATASATPALPPAPHHPAAL